MPYHYRQAGARGRARPPGGEVTIVFSDITRAASLWEFNPEAMCQATLLHNSCLRELLLKHDGYEANLIREKNSGEGSFCMIFPMASNALAWCVEVQQALVNLEWPEALLEHPGAAEERADTADDRYLIPNRLTVKDTCELALTPFLIRIVFKGLRVRMGMHVGVAVKTVQDPMTRRLEYVGPAVNSAARITALSHGGQVVMSQRTLDKINSELVESINSNTSTISLLSMIKSWWDHHGNLREGMRRGVTALGLFELPDNPSGK